MTFVWGLWGSGYFLNWFGGIYLRDYVVARFMFTDRKMKSQDTKCLVFDHSVCFEETSVSLPNNLAPVLF